MDIAVVGDVNVDLVLAGLPGLPAYKELKHARDMRFALGGSAAIFACNAARLGAKVGFVSKVGQDEFGRFLLRTLDECGVDTSRVICDPAGRTGICVSLSFPEDYAMVSYPGIREAFHAEEIDFDYVAGARHLHMSSYYLMRSLQPGCPELFRRAKKAGMSTSLDPDHDSREKWDGIPQFLPDVDIFLPNEVEAMRLSGAADVETAVRHLAGVSPLVVAKCGSRGVLASGKGKTVSVPSFSLEPVDTTGAGDGFNAGFLFQYLRGAPLEQCLVWGNACGGLSTQALGGLEAFPRPIEVERFLDAHAAEVTRMLAHH